MYFTLSCANASNVEAVKQQKQLTERLVEMQVNEIDSRAEGNPYWQQEMRMAKEMTESGITMIKNNEYLINFFGVNVDNSLIQLICSIIIILAYIAFYGVNDKFRTSFWYDHV